MKKTITLISVFVLAGAPLVAAPLQQRQREGTPGGQTAREVNQRDAGLDFLSGLRSVPNTTLFFSGVAPRTLAEGDLDLRFLNQGIVLESVRGTQIIGRSDGPDPIGNGITLNGRLRVYFVDAESWSSAGVAHMAALFSSPTAGACVEFFDADSRLLDSSCGEPFAFFSVDNEAPAQRRDIAFVDIFSPRPVQIATLSWASGHTDCSAGVDIAALLAVTFFLDRQLFALQTSGIISVSAAASLAHITNVIEQGIEAGRFSTTLRQWAVLMRHISRLGITNGYMTTSNLLGECLQEAVNGCTCTFALCVDEPGADDACLP